MLSRHAAVEFARYLMRSARPPSNTAVEDATTRHEEDSGNGDRSVVSKWVSTTSARLRSRRGRPGGHHANRSQFWTGLNHPPLNWS